MFLNSTSRLSLALDSLDVPLLLNESLLGVILGLLEFSRVGFKLPCSFLLLR